jgi:hypothetical protein
MCGRYRRTKSEEEIARRYNIPIPPERDLHAIDPPLTRAADRPRNPGRLTRRSLGPQIGRATRVREYVFLHCGIDLALQPSADRTVVGANLLVAQKDKDRG